MALVISSRADAPALEIARQHGAAAAHHLAEILHVARGGGSRDCRCAARRRSVRAVALAGYKPILDASVVDAYPDRILNVHPSLLPAFAGGMAPQARRRMRWRRASRSSGCTVHIVTADVDAGPIVAQAAVPVLDDDTVESLSARILVEEHRLLPLALEWLLSGRLHIEQGHMAATTSEQAE